jgi:protein-S-isoprenylcysteine O-methyltransferase Ste14
MGALCRVVSRFALVVVVAAIVVLLVEGELLSLSPMVIAAQALALFVAAWARRTFAAGAYAVTAAPRGDALLATGPYRWVRHPQYAATFLLIWAGVLAHLSVLSVATGVVVVMVGSVRIVCEERLLRERFPGYAAYAARTRRLVPFVI